MFSYPAEITPVAFEAELHDSEGSLTGLIRETDDDGSGPMLLTAVVEGGRRGQSVEFRKTYDAVEPACIVEYAGTMDFEAVEISGEWVRLDGAGSGPFVMRREETAEEAQELRVEIDVPLDR
jgi:hypothetical protein